MADSREARTLASELKFVIDRSLGDAIRGWARSELHPDPHGGGTFGDEYRISSLYFDTDQHDVFNRRGSFGRAKYRVRRYTDDDTVFLERKLRNPGIVIKRRTGTPIDTLGHLDRVESMPTWPGDWFHRRLLVRGLRPTCQLSYLRMARGLLVNGASARLTLDDAVSVAAATKPHFNGKSGIAILEGMLILELKFHGHVPVLFKRLVEEFKLGPQPVSKYRFGMTALGHADTTGLAPALGARDAHA